MNLPALNPFMESRPLGGHSHGLGAAIAALAQASTSSTLRAAERDEAIVFSDLAFGELRRKLRSTNASKLAECFPG